MCRYFSTIRASCYCFFERLVYLWIYNVSGNIRKLKQDHLQNFMLWYVCKWLRDYLPVTWPPPLCFQENSSTPRVNPEMHPPSDNFGTYDSMHGFSTTILSGYIIPKPPLPMVLQWNFTPAGLRSTAFIFFSPSPLPIIFSDNPKKPPRVV